MIAAPAHHPGAVQGRTVEVSRALATRNIVSIRRLPAAFIPSLVMPIFLTISFSGAFGGFVRNPLIPFPTSNPLSWYVPQAAVQGASFAGLGVALGAIRDLQGGFFDRLAMSPIPKRALLIGPMVATAVRSFFPVALVAVVGLVGGMAVPGGFLAFVALFIVALGVAVIAGLWGLGLAYRMRSMSAAAIMQFGIFFVIFLSEAQVPVAVMQGWLEPVARYNPVTKMLRMARSGFVGDVTWSVVWPGLLAITGFILVTLAFAVRGLKKVVR
jgi:ABC-2 type transport system permease protein